jgi:hypothetical protein
MIDLLLLRGCGILRRGSGCRRAYRSADESRSAPPDE